MKARLNFFKLLLIGNDNDLTKMCLPIQQFLSGVFFAVENE